MINYGNIPPRILDKFYVDLETDCWIWTAGHVSQRQPYGNVWINGHTRRAHRVMYELCVGTIPVGLQLDHLCRVLPCVNPSHLEPVSNKVNVLRGIGITARNARKTHCLRGHPFDEVNTLVRSLGRECMACKRYRWKEQNIKRRLAS